MNNESMIRHGGASLQTFLSTWESRKEVANTLIKSGFLPPAYKTPEQVLAVMLTAHELNIPEMEALRSINVIQGKPTISPQLMLALARRSGELEDIRLERTSDAVVCRIKRKGQTAFTTRFGVAEAKGQELMGKDNYRKQPFTMFQWRSLAANLRITFGDVITGLYTPEELGAEVTVTEEGEQVMLGQHTAPPSFMAETPLNDDGPGGSDKEYDDSVPAKPEPVSVAGATFQTFDPTTEVIGFGKHKGMKFSEVPKDYMEWLAGNSTKADTKVKAEATLAWMGRVQTQVEETEVKQGDVFGSTFNDEAKTKSEKLRTGFEAKIATAKLTSSLATITKQIQDSVGQGEMFGQAVSDLMQLIDKKEDELKAAKGAKK
jgi:hypothetical protein